MPVAVAVDLLARPRGVGPVGVADEREPLCPPRFPVLGQEDARDAAVPLEDLAEVVFFGELGDLLRTRAVSH